MEELTIEEKAKRYDEALERAKYYHDRDNIQFLETIFPELKESEDERIRKAIINVFATHKDYEIFFGVSVKDIIAWLEKQGKSSNQIHYWTEEEIEPIISDYLRGVEHYGGMIGRLRCLKPKSLEKKGEQNHADKIEPKFHEGEWIVHQGTGNIYQVVAVTNNQYQLKYGNIYILQNCEDVDKCARLWDVIKDAKDGDVLACNEEILLFKSYSPQGRISLYCWYNGQTNNFHSKGVDDTLLTTRNKICPATKEQRELLFQKMKEIGYEWDAEKKEPKKIEPSSIEEVNGEDYGIDGLWHAQRILEKTLGSVDGYQSDDGILDHKAAITAVKKLYEQKPSDWSEEDEERLRDIINELVVVKEDANVRCSERALSDIIADINWLKSLRPQKQWKPSEEQMTALAEALSLAKNCGEEWSFDLRTLHEQLKKL